MFDGRSVKPSVDTKLTMRKGLESNGRGSGNDFSPLGNRLDRNAEKFGNCSLGFESGEDIGFKHAWNLKHA